MRVLYDTRTVHPLDRYDYYRAGAGAELAGSRGCWPASRSAASTYPTAYLSGRACSSEP